MHPTLLEIGPLTVYSYGFMVAIGVFFAVLYAQSAGISVGIHKDVIMDISFIAILSGFIGARIFYVIEFWNYFSSNLLDVFKLWQGGIVFYGGVIGGFIGLTAYVRAKQLNYVQMLDLFMPAVALAQAFGRVGCFLNGCCYGKASALPWAVHFPGHDRLVHPTQLYEALFCFALAGFLAYFWRKKPVPGLTSLAYFTIYPAGRFVIEFLRGDQSLVHGLTIAQWISAGIITIATVCAFVFYGKKRTHRPA